MREDDRAVILSTFADPLVRRWLNIPAKPSDADFDSVLRTIRNVEGVYDVYRVNTA